MQFLAQLLLNLFIVPRCIRLYFSVTFNNVIIFPRFYPCLFRDSRWSCYLFTVFVKTDMTTMMAAEVCQCWASERANERRPITQLSRWVSGSPPNGPSQRLVKRLISTSTLKLLLPYCHIGFVIVATAVDRSLFFYNPSQMWYILFRFTVFRSILIRMAFFSTLGEKKSLCYSRIS